jgi:hypothetical protein
MQTVAPKRAIQVVTKGRNVCVCAYSMPLTRPLRRLQGPNYQPTKFQLVIGYHPLDGEVAWDRRAAHAARPHR